MSELRAREYARQVAADYLKPLMAAEIQVWVAAREGSPSPAAQVARWRYLNDSMYHARVFLWEQSSGAAAPPGPGDREGEQGDGEQAREHDQENLT